MFTNKRLQLPQMSGDWKVDGPRLYVALSQYLQSLETPDALSLEDYQPNFTAKVTDGSGAALALTVNVAKYIKLGRRFVIHLDVTYPVTASGAAAQLNGIPFTEANHAIGALYNNGAGGGTVAQLTGAVVNFYTNAGVAITNANLSAATIRTTITGLMA